MLEQLIAAYLRSLNGDDLAECFWETYGKHGSLSDLENEELQSINGVLDEIKEAKILQKHAIAELSEYHKALKKEIKEREEDYF
jgi:hypothetical protein